MFLTRLKYWREYRGYSLRQLAEKSKIPYSAISLLENGKREPQGRTIHKLAAALEVNLSDLYTQSTPKITQLIDDNKTITQDRPARATRTRPRKQQTVPKNTISYWIFEKDQEENDPYRIDTQGQAERLKEKLGGQHRARVYETASKSEAFDQHLQFLIKVARGHDYW